MTQRSPSPSSVGLSAAGTSSQHTSHPGGPRRAQSPSVLPNVRVITSPPWARDETPSPPPMDDETHDPWAHTRIAGPSAPQAWDASSSTDSLDEEGRSRWWVFARPRRPSSPTATPSASHLDSHRPTSGDEPQNLTAFPKRPFKERSRTSTWLLDPGQKWKSRRRNTLRSEEEGVLGGENAGDGNEDDERETRRDGSVALPTQLEPVQTRKSVREAGLRLEMPDSYANGGAPITLTHTQTPGWNTPWAAWHVHRSRLSYVGEEDYSQHDRSRSRTSSRSQGGTKNSRRWKRLRKFVLHNHYVPLLLRIINLALSTTTLGIAVSQRKVELHHQVLGAFGSSVTLVIIFAPLTIVHVILACYLEYFGKPLGLWRTSSKLLHALVETIFISAWSAALSLTFDNFFTSPLQCAPIGSTHWWNDLPPENNPLGVNVEGSVSDDLCDHGIALIVLVMISLITYCGSLFVSLFRIFDRVKVRSVALDMHP